MAGLQGTYDPNTYDPGRYATWPKVANPGDPVLYQPGMYWTVSTPGTWNGEPIAQGDRLYVFGTSRKYGAYRYGNGIFGGSEDRDWITQDVTFRAWHPGSGWETDAPPFAGCPLVDGWRIVVETYHDPDEHSRRFGDLMFGDALFGDLPNTGTRQWVDVTEPHARVVAARGAYAGETWQVPPDALTLDALGPDAWPIEATPLRGAPNVADYIRVGVLDPLQGYHPLSTGIVEQIVDDHDAPPRAVTVEAFGVVTDLAAQLPGVITRPAEPAGTRLRWIADQTGYRWGPPTFVEDPGPTVTAYGPEVNVSGLDLADLTAISAGWSLDTDARGVPRARRWPLDADPMTALIIGDCVTAPCHVWSPAIRFVADTASTINTTTVADVAEPPNVAVKDDPPSIARLGIQTTGAGVPLPQLHAAPARLAEYADRIIDRFAGILHRVETVYADTDRDPRWVAVLADLDRGHPVQVRRTEGGNPTTFVGYVAGIEHDLGPGRWAATITIHTTSDTVH